MGLGNVRLLIVVESADYQAALSNIFMPERLYEQLSDRLSPVDIHIVTAAVRWSMEAQEVAIFSCHSEVAYSDLTYLKIRVMGSGIPLPKKDEKASGKKAKTRARRSNAEERQLVRQVADFCPTHVVMCTRSRALLTWAIRNRIPSVALFSDWYEPLGWAERRRHAKFIQLLNEPRVSWVGGQGILACKIMDASGVDSAKVIPWEWSQPQLLNQYEPKTLRPDTASVKLVYVGSLNAEAGMGDLLKGTLLLQRSGYTVTLQLIRDTLNDTAPIASEETAWLENRVRAMELDHAVTVWTGLAPEQILERVRDADIAVIPQPGTTSPKHHPTLPLGVAVAMATRTPLVACDHKELSAHLYHGANAIIFPTGSPESMVHRIERVMGQPSLYAQLSDSSQITLDKIKVPARWAALIELWMTNSPYDRQRLRDFALSSGRYQLTSVERDPFGDVLT